MSLIDTLTSPFRSILGLGDSQSTPDTSTAFQQASSAITTVIQQKNASGDPVSDSDAQDINKALADVKEEIASEQNESFFSHFNPLNIFGSSIEDKVENLEEAVEEAGLDDDPGVKAALKNLDKAVD